MPLRSQRGQNYCEPLKLQTEGAFTHSREQLANDFRGLGVRAGDVVMLHASVRAVEKSQVAPIRFILPSKMCSLQRAP
jgi:hypothetical protein